MHVHIPSPGSWGEKKLWEIIKVMLKCKTVGFKSRAKPPSFIPAVVVSGKLNKTISKFVLCTCGGPSPRHDSDDLLCIIIILASRKKLLFVRLFLDFSFVILNL